MGRGTLFFILLAGAPSSAAIFGTDTRVAVTPSSSANVLGRRTAIAVLSSLYTQPTPQTVSLSTDALSDALCPDQRFVKDPSLEYSCTGFLVGTDLIATAGHCMVNTGEDHNETDTYCQAYSWLFDYQTSDAGTTAVTGIAADKLYHCKQVIYAVRDEQAPFRDYALVQLDRPVLDREPLTLSTLNPTDTLSMIGYPLGGPETLSIGAQVLLNASTRQSFITNLDALDGNSGSPVFSPNGEVVGILVAGTPQSSLIQDPSGCQRVNHCDVNGNNCSQPDANTSIFPGFQRTGSEVQRIQPIQDLISPGS